MIIFATNSNRVMQDMKLTMTDKSIFIHEFGHILTIALVYGVDMIERVWIKGTLEGVDGHTVIKNSLLNITPGELERMKAGEVLTITSYGELKSDRSDVMVYFGGVVAEYICGYTKAKMHRGTDADKIKDIMPDKKQQAQVWGEVYSLLEPHKELIKSLANWLIDKVEFDEQGYSVLVSGDDIKEILKSYGIG